MNSVPTFNVEKYCLGSLCKNKHDYQDSGKSLRYKAQKLCVECARSRALRLLQEDSEVELARRRKYYAENKEKIASRCAKYCAENKEKIAAKRRKTYFANREKRLAEVAAYRDENREKVREVCRKYYYSHREQRLASSSKWRQENKQKRKIYSQKYHAAYYLKNKEKINARISVYKKTEAGKALLSRQNSARSARLRGVHSARYTSQQLLERFSEFDNSCAYCGRKEDLTADHFIALSTGGSDCLGNIVCACRSCNSRKSYFDPLEWYTRQAFYQTRKWTRILRILGKTANNYNQIPLL